MIETPRLILRPFTRHDLDTMSSINQDSRVMEYFPALQTRADTELFITKSISRQREYGFSFYAADLKSISACIGFIGLAHVSLNIPFTPAVEIAWRLSADYWGQGLATEGARAVLDYGFTTLDLSKVVSFTATQNVRSQRVMEKIGLSRNVLHDFDHPSLPCDSPLRRHVYYDLTQADYSSCA